MVTQNGLPTKPSTTTTAMPESPQIIISSSDEPEYPLTNQCDSQHFISVKIVTPNFSNKFNQVFDFSLDETIWKAKQTVLMKFAASNGDVKDPLNFGFYMPPHSGRSGKFLDEERYLREYPMDSESCLEFRYKRRIFRHVQIQDEKRLQKINTRKHRKRFMEYILVKNMSGLEKLLQKGLDPNYQDERSGDTPLILATTLDDCMPLLKLLIQYGAFLDFRSCDGRTALHNVVSSSKVDTLRALLDLGASPNYKDTKGLTPLYHSIIYGSNPLICETLLNDCCEIGVSDICGSAELHQACKLGHVQHLEHLIYYGADVNSRTASGNTPLHICALENQESCASVLLFRGADRSITNYAQQSAYDVAVLTNNFEVAAVISEFKDKDIKRFVDKPTFSGRRRNKNKSNDIVKKESSSSVPSSPTPNLYRAISSSDMHTLSLRRTRKSSTNSLPTVIDDSDSESEDSEDDENLKPVSKGRTFSNAGVGTKRSPAPMTVKSVGPVNLKARLYASVPGRQFVAITDYEPVQLGELSLEKGDIVDVLYVGEQGFWEGRVKGRAGWFPSYCVQETKKGKSAKVKQRSWFGKKNPMEILDRAMQLEPPKARVVSLKRSEKGYGFQLRGANSHVPHIEFTPSPQFPALQYIGEVDKGGVAEKSGLRPGDFVLEINNENVVNATHGYAVSLISKGSKSLTIKVITVAPESVSPDLILPNGSLRCKNAAHIKEALKASAITDEVKKPPPPMRSTSTCLTHFEDLENSILSDASVAVAAETVVLENTKTRKGSVKGMWAGSAFKLQGDEPEIREDNIVGGMGRKQKGLSKDLAAEFDEKFKLITKQITIDASQHPLVQPKPLTSVQVEPKTVPPSPPLQKTPSVDADMYESIALRPASSTNSSSSSLSSNNSNALTNGSTKDIPKRTFTPPNYEYTLDSLRIGRANSIGRGDNVRTVSMVLPEKLSTLEFERRSTQEFKTELSCRNNRDQQQSYRSIDSRKNALHYREQYGPYEGPMARQPNRQYMYSNSDDMSNKRRSMVESYLEDQQFAMVRRPNHRGSPVIDLAQLNNYPERRQRDPRQNYGRAQSELYNSRFDPRQPPVDRAYEQFRQQQYQQQQMRSRDSRHQLERVQQRNQQETVLQAHQNKVYNPDTDYRVVQELPVNQLGCKQSGPQNRLPSPDGLTLQTRVAQQDGLVISQHQRQQQMRASPNPYQGQRVSPNPYQDQRVSPPLTENQGRGSPPLEQNQTRVSPPLVQNQQNAISTSKQNKPTITPTPYQHKLHVVSVPYENVNSTPSQPPVAPLFTSMPPPPPPLPINPPTSYLDLQNKSSTVITRSSNVFENSLADAVAARTMRIQSKKDCDTDSLGSIGKDSLHRTNSSQGSECISLYNSSSSVSLDSSCSKDSGFDNDGVVDHSSALAQAIAARAAKMASKENSNTNAVQLPTTKEVPEPEKSLEEIKLLKPGEMKKRNTIEIRSNELNLNEVDNGYSSPTFWTKPKPKRSAAIDSSDSNNNNSKLCLSEDTATLYLDDIIADAEASIDYDLISTEDGKTVPQVSQKPTVPPPTAQKPVVPPPTALKPVVPKQQATSIIKTNDNPIDVLPPPPVELITGDKNLPLPDEDDDGLPPPPPMVLPPPPVELLNESSTATVIGQQKAEERLTALSDPPPPYTPFRSDSMSSISPSNSIINVPVSLVGKPFTEWNTLDVCDWLDHLNLSQYKEAFIENDIEGKHLPDLSKDELKELGVKKLGHRMTLDDAINKMCNNNT